MSVNFDEDAYRNQVKVNYEFSTWSGRTKVGDNVRLSGLRIQPDDLQGWKQEAKEDLPKTGKPVDSVRYIYCPRREPGGQRFVANVFECISVFDAHEALIDVVMTYMARKLPRCETKGLEVGDICFGGHGEINLSVIFARFNILVEVKSTTPGPESVNEFARTLDSLILSQYTQPK